MPFLLGELTWCVLTVRQMDALEAFLNPPTSCTTSSQPPGETPINTGTFQVDSLTQESAVAGATTAGSTGAGDTYDENDQEVRKIAAGLVSCCLCVFFWLTFIIVCVFFFCFHSLGLVVVASSWLFLISADMSIWRNQWSLSSYARDYLTTSKH